MGIYNLEGVQYEEILFQYSTYVLLFKLQGAYCLTIL